MTPLTQGKRHAQYLAELLGGRTYRKIKVEGYIPLSIERIGQNEFGREQISVCHYGEQDGDLMREPEMVFELVENQALPTYFRNDYTGTEQFVYQPLGGRWGVRPGLRRDLASFADTWFRNLREQGFFD